MAIAVPTVGTYIASVPSQRQVSQLVVMASRQVSMSTYNSASWNGYVQKMSFSLCLSLSLTVFYVSVCVCVSPSLLFLCFCVPLSLCYVRHLVKTYLQKISVVVPLIFNIFVSLTQPHSKAFYFLFRFPLLSLCLYIWYSIDITIYEF